GTIAGILVPGRNGFDHEAHAVLKAPCRPRSFHESGFRLRSSGVGRGSVEGQRGVGCASTHVRWGTRPRAAPARCGQVLFTVPHEHLTCVEIDAADDASLEPFFYVGKPGTFVDGEAHE